MDSRRIPATPAGGAPLFIIRARVWEQFPHSGVGCRGGPNLRVVESPQLCSVEITLDQGIMAELSDLSLKDRLWYHRYSFRRVDPLPFLTEGPPLAEARVAVVTSAGVHEPQDPPFEKVKGGDFSFRWVSRDAPLQGLTCSHPSGAWNRTGVEADGNMALPLDRLRELQEAGVIGEIAPRHASFQGSITAPMRLMRQTAPEAAQGMADDGVDVVLLTPV